MPPFLVLNPRSDRGFVALAQRLVAEASAVDPRALERLLRETYPRAIVRERMLSAEREVTWYVYREGTWTPNES